MGGASSECVSAKCDCVLSHATQNDPRPCGSCSDFTVTTGTGFGTNATSFSSTLSGTATPALNGTLVECSGMLPRDAEIMVGNSTLQILGQYHVFIFIFFLIIIIIIFFYYYFFIADECI